MRHVEFLIEDISGQALLSKVLPKILPEGVTFATKAYKGIGAIPRNLNANADPKKRILLDNLPRLIRGYGKTFRAYGDEFSCALVIVCDLDSRDFNVFTGEIQNLVQACDPRPETIICLAVEEGEAWLLGDQDAIFAAYPHCKKSVLQSYTQDSICGTWEILADALEEGGAANLRALGYQAVGSAKSRWAEAIGPKMSVDQNQSESFNDFVDKLREFSQRN